MEVDIKKNMGFNKNEVWITIKDIPGSGVIVLPGEKTLQKFAYSLLEKTNTVKGNCASCNHSIELEDYECDSNKMDEYCMNIPNPSNKEVQDMLEKACPCWEVGEQYNKKDEPHLFE